MALAASEVRLLLAARKIYETGESLQPRCYGEPIESHDISLTLAMEECEKYFQGSHAAYLLAKERLSRQIDEVSQRYGFWARSFLMNNGFCYWREIKLPEGGGRIVPGNVSQGTFENWCVLATMAYIDRIIETGEVK